MWYAQVIEEEILIWLLQCCYDYVYDFLHHIGTDFVTEILQAFKANSVDIFFSVYSISITKKK